MGRPTATLEQVTMAIGLAAMGWSYKRIGRELGIKPGSVHFLCTRRKGWVQEADPVLVDEYHRRVHEVVEAQRREQRRVMAEALRRLAEEMEAGA